jgi:hypothetical protein
MLPHLFESEYSVLVFFMMNRSGSSSSLEWVSVLDALQYLEHYLSTS